MSPKKIVVWQEFAQVLTILNKSKNIYTHDSKTVKVETRIAITNIKNEGYPH